MQMPAPSLAADKVEWIIKTMHTGSGKYAYYITDDAVKLESLNNGGIAISRAPTWRVSCFRPSEKLEFTSELKDFDFRRIFPLMPKRNMIIIPATKVGQEKLKGLPCDKYKLGDGSMFWTPAALKTAPQVVDMMTRYFGTPAIAFVAVRNLKSPGFQKMALNAQARAAKKQTVPWMSFHNFEMNPTERLSLDLTDWKKVAYKPSDFEYPVGYRRTNDLKEVIISDPNRKQLLDLMGTFGGGDEDAESSVKTKTKP